MGWLFLLLAFFLAGAGYLVKYKGRVDLIAGYEPGAHKDEAALARRFGDRLFVAAGIALVFAPFGAIYRGFGLFFLLGYITILILGGMFTDPYGEDRNEPDDTH